MFFDTSTRLVGRERSSVEHHSQRVFSVLLDKTKRRRFNTRTGILTRNRRALRFYEKLGFAPLSTGVLLDLQKRMLSRSQAMFGASSGQKPFIHKLTKPR